MTITLTCFWLLVIFCVILLYKVYILERNVDDLYIVLYSLLKSYNEDKENKCTKNNNK